MGDIYRDTVLRTDAECRRQSTERIGLLVYRTAHHDIHRAIVLLQHLHRQHQRIESRAVVQTLAAQLSVLQLARCLSKDNRCTDADGSPRVLETGVDQHLMHRHRLVLFSRLEQMRRHTGHHTVARRVGQNGHLRAEQHARIDAAHLRKTQKSAVQHIRDHKADLIQMRIQQHGFDTLLSAGQPSQHRAVCIDLRPVAIWGKQLACSRRGVSLKSGHAVRTAQPV